MSGLKIVFCDTNNVHLALGVFSRVRGVRGVDHDRLTEFAPDCPERCLSPDPSDPSTSRILETASIPWYTRATHFYVPGSVCRSGGH